MELFARSIDCSIEECPHYVAAEQLPHLSNVYQFYKDTKKHVKHLGQQGMLRGDDAQPMTEAELQIVEATLNQVREATFMLRDFGRSSLAPFLHSACMPIAAPCC